MGCGCNKRKNGETVVQGASASRQAVYQVVDGSNQVLSEYSTPQEARQAAVAAGGRVRITSKAKAGVVT